MNDPRDRTPDEPRTHRLRRPARPAVPDPRTAPEAAADYSATALNWPQPTVPPEAGRAHPPTVREPLALPLPAYDDDAVLRFGPGVPASPPGGDTAAMLWHAATAPPPRRRPAWRRYLLAAAVLLCSLAFALWQWWGSGLAVESVRVSTDPGGPACDSTAEIVATVRTNGRGGTLRYHWERSDGTRSGELREQFGRGQEEARVELLWRFEGRGSVTATAELVISAPQPRAEAVTFTYSCP
ncbi:hypothetical protein ACFQLX_04780 [Streptomyces polyrhachis]|uniref:Ig-like domain-containing protein n=1 Tax=Streptomyces polyrhachis TaxID=1282885 RepID=A0ABW2GDL8_9ACTN